METWFGRTIDEVLKGLSTSVDGLTDEAAARMFREHGPNRLEEQRGREAWRIMLAQFKSLMVGLLIAAALVSGVVLGEYEDAIVIGVVVVLNALLGFRQEFKAEKAMAALKRLAVPSVRVKRGGEERAIPAVKLVPGDVMQLGAGALVPADCRLIECANLRIEEATLTGEAEPAQKQTDALVADEPPLGDRTNMAFMGTVVTYGRGVGVVTATGMDTELGHIATLIQGAEKEDTVLQKKLAQTGRLLVVAAIVLIGLVALEGWLIRQMAAKEIFMTAVSMAVAAIPEGLPAVVTIALALGAQRMLRRRALIRRLPAVETLGSVTVICSDKTGTLTQNRMTVCCLVLPDREINLPEEPTSRAESLTEALVDNPDLELLLAAGVLCNDAELVAPDGRGGQAEVLGDPTEGALLAVGDWVGLSKADLNDAYPRVGERPFDSDRKRMTTLHQIENGNSPATGGLGGAVRQWADSQGKVVAGFTKGAVDSVLACASHVWVNGQAVVLDDTWRARLEARNDRLAEAGVRVLGVAVRGFAGPVAEEDEAEANLVYLGMVGMRDPLRQEVAAAVDTCHRAGMRPVMITGDHPLIAKSIGDMLELKSPGGIRTGKELAGMARTDLEATVRDVSIYARVSPEHKLRIVDALQKNGEIVAMTGDGVNDAPALKEADIGVAMGITGTDVTKEAADMILLDDNFATIVGAVEQGRITLDNIIRFVRYILASNWAEILVMLVAPLLGMPLPLFPVQILWMNLVTDGLPALALGVEPGEKDVMNRPPRRPDAPIIDRTTGLHILFVGTLMAGLSLWLGWTFYSAVGTGSGGSGDAASVGSVWQTMLFTALVVAQLTLALAERGTSDSVFRRGLMSNPYMMVALGGTVLLQLGVVYLPSLQRFFKTTPLSPTQLLWCVLPGIGVFVAVEIKKAVLRGRSG